MTRNTVEVVLNDTGAGGSNGERVQVPLQPGFIILLKPTSKKFSAIFGQLQNKLKTLALEIPGKGKNESCGDIKFQASVLFKELDKNKDSKLSKLELIAGIRKNKDISTVVDIYLI